MNDFLFSRRLWMLAGLAAFAVVAIVLYQSRSTAIGHDDMQKLIARMDAMEAKIDTQQQMAHAQSDPFAGGPSSGGADRQPIAGAAAQPAAPPTMPSAAQVQHDEAKMRHELDAQFAAQGRAPPNDSAPQQVTAAFNSDAVLGGLSVPESRNVQCRAGMCLIRASFAPGADESDWMARMMLELGQTLPGYRALSVPQPNGGLEVRIYAARPANAGGASGGVP